MKVLVASAFASQAWATYPSWDQYKAQYGLSFNGKDDVAHEAAYYENLRFVMSRNEEQTSYLLGVNKFSFMSTADFIDGFTGEAGADPESALFERAWDTSRIASRIDWTEDKAIVNPVKDQGHCGSCWAFAATGTTESSYAIDFGKLFDLSEQQLVDCEEDGLDHPGEGGCRGGLSRFAWISGGIYDKNGICAGSDYPYEGIYNTCRQSACTPVIPPGFIVGFVEADKTPQGLQVALMERPMKVSVHADDIWHSYSSGVAMEGECYTSTNHAVIAVGFGGDDYFKIRNSWGSDWGEGGYIRVSPSTKCDTGAWSLFYRTPVYPQWSTKSITV